MILLSQFLAGYLPVWAKCAGSKYPTLNSLLDTCRRIDEFATAKNMATLNSLLDTWATTTVNVEELIREISQFLAGYLATVTALSVMLRAALNSLLDTCRKPPCGRRPIVRLSQFLAGYLLGARLS